MRRVIAWFLTAAATWAVAAPPARLGLNENAFGPPPPVAAAVHAAVGDLAYYTGADAARLVAAIAEREGVDADQIVLGELLEALGLHLGLRAGAGAEFIYSVPGYPALVDAAARVGGRVVGVPLDAGLRNDLPAIAARIHDRTAAVFLVNPHNPSGTVSARDDWHAFLRAAAARTVVVVDEAYLEYSPDFAELSAVGHTREGANVVVYRTFGKAYGLAALPLGYAVAPRELAAALRSQGVGAFRDQNRLAVAAALAALADRAYLPRLAADVGAERVRWHDWLDARGLRRTDSVGNFVFFDSGQPHADLAAALAARGVIVARAFPPYGTWLRVTIGRPEDNARAREALAATLKERSTGRAVSEAAPGTP